MYSSKAARIGSTGKEVGIPVGYSVRVFKNGALSQSRDGERLYIVSLRKHYHGLNCECLTMRRKTG